jgi:hypothetical protein
MSEKISNISEYFTSKPIDSFEKKSSKAFERLLVILFILSGFTTVQERAEILY